MDMSTVAAAMPTAVPMVGTLNLRFDHVEPQRAVLTLPDQAAYHNHLGGPHAGAMFTLGESASGALVLGNFGDKLAEAVPLAVESSIRYRKLAMGEVQATATMSRTRDEVLADLGEGKRPEFTVEVIITTSDGTVTGEMTIVWTLKPVRR